MTRLTEEQIREMFEAFGLETEEEREELRQLSAPFSDSDDLQEFVRLDTKTKSPEVAHAKLAQTSR